MRDSVWEAPLKKVGGASASAIHVQVHSQAGKPLGSVASAEQHPRPHPPPAPSMATQTARVPRQPGAAGQGPPTQARRLTWRSTLSVAMHWLLARVVISRLFGVSIRQLQRGTSWRPSVSPASGPLASPAGTADASVPPRHPPRRPATPGSPATGRLQTRSRQHTGNPGQDPAPHEESARLPCSVSELQPQIKRLGH